MYICKTIKMSYLLENIEYHAHCINVWEKYEQEGEEMTPEVIQNLNEHKRLYRLLKDHFIAGNEPRRYRVQMLNTLSGSIEYSQVFNSTFDANQFKQDAEDIYPFMLCTVIEQ